MLKIEPKKYPRKYNSFGTSNIMTVKRTIIFRITSVKSDYSGLQRFKQFSTNREILKKNRRKEKRNTI